MKIYRSTEYIENPQIGDLKLSVNFMWDFSSRSVCFSIIYNQTISYDLKKCIDFVDVESHHTKWEQAEINNEILIQLESDGYIVNNKLKIN